MKWATKKDPDPICGIYKQKSKWYFLKYWFFRFMLYRRKKQNQNASTATGKDAGYGMRSRNTPEDMDKPQILPQNKPLVSKGFCEIKSSV